MNVPEKHIRTHTSLDKWKFSQSSHKCTALLLVWAHYSEELPRNLKWAPLTATSWKPFRVKNNNKAKEVDVRSHVDLQAGRLFFYSHVSKHALMGTIFCMYTIFALVSLANIWPMSAEMLCLFWISKLFYMHMTEWERTSPAMNELSDPGFFDFFK